MMKERSRFLILGIAALATCSSVHAAGAAADRHNVRYTITEIPLPENPRCLEGFARLTFARRLNEKAQVVGYDYCYQASENPTEPYYNAATGFRWSRSAGHSLLPPINPSALDTYGRDINEAGTTVGWEFTNTEARAPLWPLSGGVTDSIEPMSCAQDIFVLAEAINDRGVIAGRDVRLGSDNLCGQRWVLKLPSGQEILGPTGTPRSLNNDGLMVGESNGNAIKWKPGAAEILLAAGNLLASPQIRASAWSVSSCGEAVGYVETHSPVTSEAKFWSADGVEQTLANLPGSTASWALGINSNSTIVGSSLLEPSAENEGPAQRRGVVWNNGRPTDLNKLIPKAKAEKILINQATSINDRGQIIVKGIRRNEAKMPCPNWVDDPATGEWYYDPSLTCRSEYGYLLTPVN